MEVKDKWRIMIVDDEVSNIDALCQILMPLYNVIVAKNGQSAIDKASKHMPDLILLDVIMPDMSGFEVISILKQAPDTAQIPIIFITGLDSSEDEEKGLLLGAVDYIAKPFNGSIVMARVRTHLQIIEHVNMIERLCKVDALTNIANRRYFDSQLISEWDRAMRDERPVSIIVIDIDHFKHYNDTYGHAQGDVLLKALAEVFERALNRPSDFVARYGGEEFVVLLPNTDQYGALFVAERIRTSVEDLTVPCPDGTLTSVTVSLGVNTQVPERYSVTDGFFSLADKALYMAKNTGRNRICSATPEDSS